MVINSELEAHDRRDEVVILDDIVLPADQAEGWLMRWRHEYLPAATARGLRPRSIWRGGTRDPDFVTIVVHWTVPTIDAFFTARRHVQNDPSVMVFWRVTDEIAISRDRRVLASEEVKW